MIPKIIHQIWRDRDIPYQIYDKRWIESWTKMNTEWEYKLWTYEDLRDLIKNKYSWFLPVYDAYPFDICRIDSARYFILYEYGGLYSDLDSECLKSFNPLLCNDAVFGYQWEPISDNRQDSSIPIALMMSVPKHPLWDVVFKKLSQSFENYKHSSCFVSDERYRKCIYGNLNLAKDVHYLTGSGLLYFSIMYHKLMPNMEKEAFSIKICPTYYFYPIPCGFLKNDEERLKMSNSMIATQFPGSYSVTYWSGAWSYHPELYQD